MININKIRDKQKNQKALDTIIKAYTLLYNDPENYIHKWSHYGDISACLLCKVNKHTVDTRDEKHTKCIKCPLYKKDTYFLSCVESTCDQLYSSIKIYTSHPSEITAFTLKNAIMERLDFIKIMSENNGYVFNLDKYEFVKNRKASK